MIIRTLAITYSRKFNLGNYNSVDLSCSLWAQIDPEEDEETCINILRDKCREHVRNEYRKAKKGSEPVELFRVNVGDIQNVDEDEPTFYNGLEPDESF
jgi:hypothetical protein